MSNFNIEIDLLKLKGAKVQDVQGRTETRRCICIPIENRIGTVTDAYFTRGELSGELVEVKKKGVMLALTAFELRSKERGQSHLLKPALAKDVFDNLSEEQQHKIPWIGNMKPWNKPEGGSDGGDW